MFVNSQLLCLPPVGIFNHVRLHYSRTSRERPSKMSSLRGRQWEVVSNTVLSDNCASLAYGNSSDLLVFECFIHVKSQFREKNRYYNSGNFYSCTTQECNNVTTPYHPILVLSSVKWSLKGGLKRRNFQTVISNSTVNARGPLREVISYKRFQI